MLHILHYALHAPVKEPDRNLESQSTHPVPVSVFPLIETVTELCERLHLNKCSTKQSGLYQGKIWQKPDANLKVWKTCNVKKAVWFTFSIKWGYLWVLLQVYVLHGNLELNIEKKETLNIDSFFFFFQFCFMIRKSLTYKTKCILQLKFISYLLSLNANICQFNACMVEKIKSWNRLNQLFIKAKRRS